ncbi:hypothetical protein [Pelagibaculum spongiae]|uniref:AraC family transcriptional regulator n=1 Tax=Pelagibaculum spongiae TaxID=2080658 RepID=A0A2V1GQ06_9GAMM|nr:hypothetical protein [Pelagibaculum spongiae]PVZ62975.1 hypothetical protein DC094_21655 [Pelagibaculum spongiae]
MKTAFTLALAFCLSAFSAQAQENVLSTIDQPVGIVSEIVLLPSQDLNRDISVLKDELVNLRADLLELEQQILIPPSSRLDVFFSMDLGQSLMPDAMTIYLDDQEIAHHLYTERQQAALTRGAVHPVFTGNVSQGKHELRVLLVGQHQKRELRRAVSHVFNKEGQVVSLEFSLQDVQQGGQLSIIDHSPEKQ